MPSPPSSSTSPSAPQLASAAVARSLAICTLFIALSTWCTLYNKYIFENIFRSSNCLLFVQNLITVVVLVTGKAFGWLEFRPSFGATDWITGAMYGVNVMTGLWSLVFVNIAIFSTLKRCTVVFSWMIEYVFTRTATTSASLGPLAVMLVGTLMAGYFDLQFSGVGYLLSAISCLTQASAFELGRRMTSENKGVCSVLLINSLASVGMQLAMITFTGEIQLLFPQNLNTPLLLHFLLNALSCLAMNYSIFLNCQVNSPLAHAVTGNIKAVMTTLIGILLFTSRLEFLGWVGIMGNFVGAAWFSWLKLEANTKKVPKDESKSVV